MKNLLLAFRFLTILPFGRTRLLDAPKIIPHFTLVGLGLGLILVFGDHVFSMLWPSPVVSLLDVLLLAFLSGGLHLDGLGDTADGLLSHKPREQALAIMRDSRIGVMGLLAVVFVLSVKWASIQSLVEDRGLFLFVIPAYSRGAMIFGIQCLDYGRPEGGLGTDFFSERAPIYVLSPILLPVLFSCRLGWFALWFNSLFLLITALTLYYFRRRAGCITGDMLGATVEVEEAWLFLVAGTSPPIFA
jgi:adenosylcobinamide-GDP ribazoletransferase